MTSLCSSVAAEKELTAEELRRERDARSVALEKAYVHDVYQQISAHFADGRYRAWPRVKQFLMDLEPGSLICDVGCGNGKYLNVNNNIFKIGSDRCSALTEIAREKEHEVLQCDNLNLPFRDESFDATLSIAVIHHLATTERRVAALKELARILRIGGRLIVSVWAMEQRHRKFESQDVLVPWHRPQQSSSDDKTSSIERDLNSTTTSDDDAMHYHAYTQTSDSDSCPSSRQVCRKRGRGRHKGRSIDPSCPSSSQSSSDLSSPNETCYSFVRRALQKLAGGKRQMAGRSSRPWFLHSLEHKGNVGVNISRETDVNGEERQDSQDSQDNIEDLPIELRRLDAEEAELVEDCLQQKRRKTFTSRFSHDEPVSLSQKSKSLSDLLSVFPTGFLKQRRSHEEVRPLTTQLPVQQTAPTHDVSSDEASLVRSKSSGSSLAPVGEGCATDEVESGWESSSNGVAEGGVKDHADVDRDDSGADTSELTEPEKSSIKSGDTDNESSPSASIIVETATERKRHRPSLVKQKHSIGHYDAPVVTTTVDPHSSETPEAKQATIESTTALSRTTSEESSENDVVPTLEDMRHIIRTLPEFKVREFPLSSTRRAGVQKQTSLNDELIFSDRVREREKLLKRIQKQASLNEELVFSRQRQEKWESFKESLKPLQMLKNGFTKFRSSSLNRSESSPSEPKVQMSTTLRNGFVRILQSWKGESHSSESHGEGVTAAEGTESGETQKGLHFQSLFSRREGKGTMCIVTEESRIISGASLSPSRKQHRSGSSSEEFLSAEPNSRHERKLSREEGSDSSKDSSFQSDTSMDSEDSFASVIFVPKPEHKADAELQFGENGRRKERVNSASSESDGSRSPINRISPPTALTIAKPIARTPGNIMIAFNGAKGELKKRSPVETVIATKLVCETVDEEKAEIVDKVEEVVEIKIEESTEIKSEVKELLSTDPVKVQVTSESEVLPPPVVTCTSSGGTSQTSVWSEASLSRYNNLYNSNKMSSLLLGENVEVIRKTSTPGGKGSQVIRRRVPKFLSFEIFNPEIDDLDSDSSGTSSPDSVGSVVSVMNDVGSLTDLKEVDNESFVSTEASVHEDAQPTLSIEGLSEWTEAIEKLNQDIASEKFLETIPMCSSSCSTTTITTSTAVRPSPFELTTLVASNKSSQPRFSSTRAPVCTKDDRAPARLFKSLTTPPVRSTGILGAPRSSLGPASEPWPTMRLEMSSELCSDKPPTPPPRCPGESLPEESTVDIPPLLRLSPTPPQRLISPGLLPTKNNDLLEAAASVASSLEDAVDVVIQASPKAKRKLDSSDQPASSRKVTSLSTTPTTTPLRKQKSEDGNPDCRRHLLDFAERLSERLLAEMESYSVSLSASGQKGSCKQLPVRAHSLESEAVSSPYVPTPPSYKASTSSLSSSERGKETSSSLMTSCSSLDTTFGRLEMIESQRNLGLAGRSLLTPTLDASGDHTMSPPTRRRPLNVPISRETSLSMSTSQDSLQSDTGGSLTFHRYYHVFREGELDHLIERYVHNLHVISSYYDHSNWCIIAEKVQVWTI